MGLDPLSPIVPVPFPVPVPVYREKGTRIKKGGGSL